MSATDYLETAILNHVLRSSAFSKPSGLWLAVGTSMPSESSSTWANELSGSGYERTPLEFGDPVALTSTVEIENSNRLLFPEATANWSSFQYFAVYDAKSSGNMLCFGMFSSSILVKKYERFEVKPAGLSLTFSGQSSRYLMEQMLGLVFGDDSFSAPTVYLALTGTQPDWEDSGSDLDEPSGGSYARKQWSGGSAWTSPAQVGAGEAECENDGKISFNEATANWSPAVKYLVLTDAASGGNMLTGGSFSSGGITVPDDFTAVFQDGNVKVRAQ